MFTSFYKWLVFLVLFFWMFCTFGNLVSASESMTLKETTVKQDMYPAIDILKDYDRTLTIDDVVSPEFTHQFIPKAEIDKKHGFLEVANWLRFEVDNRSDHSDWLLEFAFPLIHELEMYVEEGGEIVALQKAGADLPFHQREIEHRNFVFNLDIEPKSSKVFYVLAVGSGDLHPPITIWSKNTFIEKTQKEFTLLGVFYGTIIVMILYNLFLFIGLRLQSYLFYVIVISCTLLGKLSINGLGFQYIWPKAPSWNLLAASFWVSLACVFILLFTKSFLNTDHHLPAFNRFITILIPLNLMVIIVSPFSRYIALYIMVIAAMITFTTVLTVAIVCLLRGARQARFYVVGWMIFLTGVTITILERAVILPYSVVTEYAGQTALTMEVVLLSLALADKINIMRQEKAIAERNAHESQKLALQNLRKSDELKDEFLAVTSHELRTPLYGMIGIAESLRDGITGKVTDNMRKQLSMIITSGHRLTDLVNEILDFSKLKYKDLELQLKPIQINEVVDIVSAVTTPLLHNKPIQLVNKLSHRLPAVNADANRLQQILYNLIGNAIKYTDEGHIVISATADETYVTMKVTDTGQGISQKALRTIFSPFQQGEDSLSRDVDGVGIGLSITKELVDLHEGKIEVESKVGEGTTFYVSIPIYKGDVSELTEVAATNAVVVDNEIELFHNSSTKTENNYTILIADDEVVNLQVLMNQLTLEGYDVITVFKGDEVHRIIEEDDIDLLILDIMMPGMSGYEVCKTLRETYTLMELPILMLTAKDQVQDKMISFEAGANDYLVKPCDKQELLSRVKTLVKAKTLNQSLIELNVHLEEKVYERTVDLNVANKDLKKMNQELVIMADSRRQLLANIAHELGTPVTLIYHYMQSLQSGLIEIDDPHYGKLVFDKISVLNRLIDDLYDLSKVRTGKMSLNIREVLLSEWMEQVRYKCEYAVLQADRSFEAVMDIRMSEKLTCFIDPERMDQLFSNLISNAIKSTQVETGKIRMTARLIDTAQLTVQISDNGIGINKEDLPFVFERFFKKDSPIKEEIGMGLGLAIVKEIVSSHGGEIRVESEENVGTTFYMILPMGS